MKRAGGGALLTCPACRPSIAGRPMNRAPASHTVARARLSGLSARSVVVAPRPGLLFSRENNAGLSRLSSAVILRDLNVDASRPLSRLPT